MCCFFTLNKELEFLKHFDIWSPSPKQNPVNTTNSLFSDLSKDKYPCVKFLLLIWQCCQTFCWFPMTVKLFLSLASSGLESMWSAAALFSPLLFIVHISGNASELTVRSGWRRFRSVWHSDASDGSYFESPQLPLYTVHGSLLQLSK